MTIPRSDKYIGFENDNLVETRVFQVPLLYDDIDLSLMEFKLDTQAGTTKNIIDLTKTVTDVITLTWVVEASHLIQDGYMAIQLRAYKTGAEVWHSEVAYVVVRASINALNSIPDPLPSEFVQMEQRVTLAKNDAVSAAETATLKVQEMNQNVGGMITAGTVAPTYGLWMEVI
jgi:hypothetical protein